MTFMRESCVVLTMLFAVAGSAAPPEQVKWLVTPHRRGASLPIKEVAAVGGRVLATYPDMHALAVPAAARDQLGRHLADFEVLELDEVIHTPRRRIDPRIDRAPAAPFTAGLFIIQFTVPATPAWQAHLRRNDIVTVETLPERSLIVAATAEQIATLTELPWVQYAGPYVAAYKFTPIGAEQRDEFLVQIADTPSSRSAIARIHDRVGGFLTTSSYDGQLVAHIRTDLVIAHELLAEPFVLGVERYVPQTPSDERQALALTGANSPSGGNYLNWLAARGITPNALTNSGIVIDIADTGLDLGCISTSGHPDLHGRKAYLKATPTLTVTEDTLRHGTIIAGIAAGNPTAGIDTNGNATQGMGMKDDDSYGQFYYGLGVAPGVRVGSTRMIANGAQGLPNDWTTIAVTSRCNTPTNICTDTAALCRAIVQNHSHNEYASANAGRYSTKSRLFDISVRHADHASGAALSITMSAGNYKQDPGDASTQVMASATAKNIIAMGAAESARETIPEACLNAALDGNSDPALRNAAGGYNVLAFTSRRGTSDGRLKPDLIAPATLSLGPKPHDNSPSGSYCANVTPADDPFFVAYHGSSGTSYAAPVAAGAIGLLRYKFGELSPAMYKAMLVGGARSITGSLDRQTGGTVTSWPNAQQGFGLINLASVLSTPASARYDQGTILLQGQYYERTITVTDPTKPLKVVLVWTDKEAAVDAPITLVNNLDLRTVGPDKYRSYGNDVDAAGYTRITSCPIVGVCTAPTDTRNNVEVINLNPVRFSGVANPSVTLRVTATTLNGVGVPGQSGGSNNQDFALFVLNGTLTP